jgi:hypothetical protein
VLTAEIRDQLAYAISDRGVPTIGDAWQLADALLPTVQRLIAEAVAAQLRAVANGPATEAEAAGHTVLRVFEELFNGGPDTMLRSLTVRAAHPPPTHTRLDPRHLRRAAVVTAEIREQFAEPCKGAVDGRLLVFACCITCGWNRTRLTRTAGWRAFRDHEALRQALRQTTR